MTNEGSVIRFMSVLHLRGERREEEGGREGKEGRGEEEKRGGRKGGEMREQMRGRSKREDSKGGEEVQCLPVITFD